MPSVLGGRTLGAGLGVGVERGRDEWGGGGEGGGL